MIDFSDKALLDFFDRPDMQGCSIVSDDIGNWAVSDGGIAPVTAQLNPDEYQRILEALNEGEVSQDRPKP